MSMKRTPLVLLAALGAACATLRNPDEAALHYQAGLQAAASHDFAAAIEHLESATLSQDPQLVQRALLLRVAVELDPRNPSRHLADAAERAMRIRDAAQPGSWERLTADVLAQAAAASLQDRDDLTIAETQRSAALSRVTALLAEVDSLTNERDTARRKAAQFDPGVLVFEQPELGFLIGTGRVDNLITLLRVDDHHTAGSRRVGEYKERVGDVDRLVDPDLVPVSAHRAGPVLGMM